MILFFFFSSRRRHTRFKCDWSSDVCSSDLYAGQGVGNAELGGDLAPEIDDDDVMMITGPIEAGVVGQLLPGFHTFPLGRAHRGAVVCRSDTRSLAGCSSLRHWDSRHGTGR